MSKTIKIAVEYDGKAGVWYVRVNGKIVATAHTEFTAKDYARVVFESFSAANIVADKVGF